MEKAKCQYYYYNKGSFRYYQIRSGVSTGIQFFKDDTAKVSVQIPLEFGARIYPNFWTGKFIDAELATSLLLINGNYLTKTLSAKVGYGFLPEKYDYSLQFHTGFMYSFVNKKSPTFDQYKRLLILGVQMELGSVPLTIDLNIPLKGENNSGSAIFLVGIRIPFFNSEKIEKEDQTPKLLEN